MLRYWSLATFVVLESSEAVTSQAGKFLVKKEGNGSIRWPGKAWSHSTNANCLENYLYCSIIPGGHSFHAGNHLSIQSLLAAKESMPQNAHQYSIRKFVRFLPSIETYLCVCACDAIWKTHFILDITKYLEFFLKKQKGSSTSILNSGY